MGLGIDEDVFVAVAPLASEDCSGLRAASGVGSKFSQLLDCFRDGLGLGVRFHASIESRSVRPAMSLDCELVNLTVPVVSFSLSFSL